MCERAWAEGGDRAAQRRGACQVGARGGSGRGLCVASELEEQRCGVQAWRRWMPLTARATSTSSPGHSGRRPLTLTSPALEARLKQLLVAVDDEEADVGDEEADVGDEAGGAMSKSIQARAAAAKDSAAVAFIVRQTLDKEAKELGKSKETMQKVRNSLDQLRVALLLKDPFFSVDGSGKVQPSA